VQIFLYSDALSWYLIYTDFTSLNLNNQ